MKIALVCGRSGVVLAAVLTGMAGASAALAQDFNGDGFSDIAIGSPGEKVGVAVAAGAVTIIYGAGPGAGLDALAPLASVQITQATFGMEVPEDGDGFGEALVWGNFNGDAFDDLAISASSEDHPISLVPDCGMVIVLYGSAAGLVPMFPPLITQLPATGPASFPDPGEVMDFLGKALAAGDFNLDGFDDLAVGTPGEDLGPVVDAGMVNIAYGSPAGLTIGPGMPLITQAAFPFGDAPEPGDGFGSALACGDMDMNGTADLAIGVPAEDDAFDSNVGMVHVVYGLPGLGLMPGLPTETFTQDSPCVPDVTEMSDRFGHALAVGNFDGFLGSDLAIGVPQEDVGGTADAGAVHVIYSAGPPGIGLETCVAPVAVEFWHQNSPGVPEINGIADQFGIRLAAGDFNGDRFGDLAIGVPGEDVGPQPIWDAGGVNVIYGGGPGLGLDAFAPVISQFWSQNTVGVLDKSETTDVFGSALTVGDFDGNGAMDLGIGVPMEDFGTTSEAGCVHVIYGAFGLGLDPAAALANELWHQGILGIPDANEAGDLFGASLDHDD